MVVSEYETDSVFSQVGFPDLDKLPCLTCLEPCRRGTRLVQEYKCVLAKSIEIVTSDVGTHYEILSIHDSFLRQVIEDRMMLCHGAGMRAEVLIEMPDTYGKFEKFLEIITNSRLDIRTLRCASCDYVCIQGADCLNRLAKCLDDELEVLKAVLKSGNIEKQ
jgi:hypothetical protein